MTPLETLVARTEIAELKARYCRLLDTKQWADYAQLFLPDVEIDISDDISPDMGDPIIRDREAFVAQTAQFMDPGQSAHHVHTSEIAFQDADHATGIWAMYDRVQFQPGGPVPFKALIGHGFYHERYVRTSQGWKIAALRLQRVVRSCEPFDWQRFME